MQYLKGTKITEFDTSHDALHLQLTVQSAVDLYRFIYVSSSDYDSVQVHGFLT